MEFLNKITETASKTYKYTTEKTSKLAKEVKIKTIINQDKAKISEIYEEIGKNVYQSYIRKEDKEPLQKIEELCKEIDAYSSEIEANRRELLKLKSLKQCPNCDFEIDLEYHFCPNCGTKQEEISNEEEQNKEETNIENNDDDCIENQKNDENDIKSDE
jgi:hypothetical protein